MTPAEAIAMLDAQLAEHGQTVKLRKTNTPAGEVPVRAFVRGYEAKELVGLIKLGDRKVTVSPSDLGAFGEPAANQFVVVDGKTKTIQGDPELIRINDVLVRVNMTVR